MINANYILKGKEPSSQTHPRKKPINLLTILGIGLILLFFYKTFTEGGSIFASSRSSILIVGMILCSLSFETSAKKVVESFEIRFYKEYLVVFRECHYYDGTNPRKQLEKFYYWDIQKCIWNKVHNQILISGKAELTTTDYDEKFNLREESECLIEAQHSCMLRTELMMKTNYQSEIERNSPIKVEIISMPSA